MNGRLCSKSYTRNHIITFDGEYENMGLFYCHIDSLRKYRTYFLKAIQFPLQIYMFSSVMCSRLQTMLVSTRTLRKIVKLNKLNAFL